MAEDVDAGHHPEDGDRGPQRRFGEVEAELLREKARHPDHDAVVAEVLHRAQHHDARADLGGGAVFDEQAERVHLGAGFFRGVGAGVAHEHFRLVQSIADHPGDDGRDHAHQEHAAPADDRQQQGCQQGRSQHADLPAESHVRRHSRAMAGRPGFCGQRHADAEFTPQPDARNRAVGEQVPVALGECAQAREDGEQHDRPGQHADAAVAIAQRAEHDAAEDGADQRPGHQRAGLPRCEVQVCRDRLQHEAQNQQVEAVHGIADGGAEQRLPAVGIDFGDHAGRGGGGTGCSARSGRVVVVIQTVILGMRDARVASFIIHHSPIPRTGRAQPAALRGTLATSCGKRAPEK